MISCWGLFFLTSTFDNLIACLPFLFIEIPDLTDEQLSRKSFDLLTSTSPASQCLSVFTVGHQWSRKSMSTRVSTPAGWADISVPGEWESIPANCSPVGSTQISVWFPLALFNTFPPACHLFGILSIVLFCAFVSATIFFFLILGTTKSPRDSLGIHPREYI